MIRALVAAFQLAAAPLAVGPTGPLIVKDASRSVSVVLVEWERFHN